MITYDDTSRMGKDQKVRLLVMIDRKLRGDARLQMIGTVRKGNISKKNATAIEARLTAMPDREDGHAKALLRPEQVRQIRAERADGALLRELAARYHVSISTVGKIVRNEIWQHMPGDTERTETK